MSMSVPRSSRKGGRQHSESDDVSFFKQTLRSIMVEPRRARLPQRIEYGLFYSLRL